MKVIDLTMTLKSHMQVYPGDPQVEIADFFSYDENGCRVSLIQMGSHSGTHVDMPAHFIEGGKTISDISLAQCMGTAYAMRANIKDGKVAVPEETVPACEILLIDTGHEKTRESGAYFTPPPLSQEIAKFIIERGFRAVGVDMPTIDCDGTVHRQLLGNGILVYEGLVNLKTIIGQRGTFCGFPLKMEYGDASPVRAVFCCDYE